MENINSVQEIINEKARQICLKRVKKIIDALREDSEIFELLHKFNVDIDNKKIPIRNAFFDTNKTIPQWLVSELLPREIELQTELFFEEIDSLKRRIAELEGRSEPENY